MRDLQKLVLHLSLEEKASLCSGAGMWHTKEIRDKDFSELGRIPSIMLSDGPSGLRKQNLSDPNSGVNNSIQAVCYPAACLSACSFDRELLYLQGKILGEECVAEDVAVLLGPGVNIKRSPLCGRNFEYFSEDPYLAGELSASWILGVQSQNISTSIKHFAVNSQEYRRMSSSSEVDERTLREIYLSAFEKAVKKGNPDSVMCSYNKINGIYASENEYLLTTILRKEWGYTGLTISDWGAVNDRVKGLLAGLDLEMPGSNGTNDARIIAAVKEGTLKESVLNEAVTRILSIIFKYIEGRNGGDTKSGFVTENADNFDYEEHHKFAIRIAQESMVLLRNEIASKDNSVPILPLDKSSSSEIVFIGDFAKMPRFQGGGSSHVYTKGVVSPYEAAYKRGLHVKFVSDSNLDDALLAAQKAKAVVIFAGLPDSYESEGFDRKTMKLPPDQNEFISLIACSQPNTVVVLQNGSPIEMPWVDKVPAILEAYLGGEGVGEAIINLLFGYENPCGKLAETFPLRLEDNPSYLNFANDSQKVRYAEGVYVGYRWYDKKNMPVLFPFGHGLSYTQFKYSDLELKVESTKKTTVMHDEDKLSITFNVTNIGNCSGKEICQIYVEDCAVTENIEETISRPAKELKNFTKVSLKPKESKLVTLYLSRRDLCWYNTNINDWYTASGKYRILIGSSSRDIRLSATFKFQTDIQLPFKFDRNSVVGDIMKHPAAAKVFLPYLNKMITLQSSNTNLESNTGKEAITTEMQTAMLQNNPLREYISFMGMSNEELDALIEELNEKLTNS
ncbi:MAG: hypothetical protein BKP49_09575 [Treponema sp. CETP13]|nr:MAG: hypothetical protein BKP49_09575 [Treponema sp. CETP13]